MYYSILRLKASDLTVFSKTSQTVSLEVLSRKSKAQSTIEESNVPGAEQSLWYQTQLLSSTLNRASHTFLDTSASAVEASV